MPRYRALVPILHRPAPGVGSLQLAPGDEFEHTKSDGDTLVRQQAAVEIATSEVVTVTWQHAPDGAASASPESTAPPEGESTPLVRRKKK